MPCQKWVPCLVASPLQWTASRSSHCEKQNYKHHWGCRTRMAWCWTSASSYQLFLEDKWGKVCGSRRLSLVQWPEETHDGTQSTIGRMKTIVNYKKSLLVKLSESKMFLAYTKNLYNKQGLRTKSVKTTESSWMVSALDTVAGIQLLKQKFLVTLFTP